MLSDIANILQYKVHTINTNCSAAWYIYITNGLGLNRLQLCANKMFIFSLAEVVTELKALEF